MSMNLSDIAILNIEDSDNCCIISGIIILYWFKDDVFFLQF